MRSRLRAGVTTPTAAGRFAPGSNRGGEAYQAVLTPISFPGWSLVTVMPEAEFLGPVEMTIRRLLLGLAVLIVVAACSRRGLRGG